MTIPEERSSVAIIRRKASKVGEIGAVAFRQLDLCLRVVFWLRISLLRSLYSPGVWSVVGDRWAAAF